MAERLIELGLVLIGLAVLARLASRVGMPTSSLYLGAGLAFGKGGLVPLVDTRDFIHVGSEIGLILLLFMLGLEHSSSELLQTMRRSARAGLLDVSLNAIPGFAAGLLLGLGLVPALFLGGITMVSSSGIVAKSLAESGDRAEAAFVVSILVIEDLTMALYMPILGVLAVGGVTLGGLAGAALATAVALAALFLAQRVEVGVSRVIFSRSDEALLLSILGLAIFTAGLAEAVQVSAAVGALLAGIALSGPAAHGARTLLRPLRDLFAALFFAFIGLSVDPGELPAVLVPAGVLAFVGTATKVATGRLGGVASGLGPRGALRSGMLLIPRGEFSIALAGLAVAAGIDGRLLPLTVAYVLMLAIGGPVIMMLVLRRADPTRIE